MRALELFKFSRRLLRGRRISTAAVCIMPVIAELFFRFAEAAIYAMLLYFSDMKPIELFGSRNPIQLVTLISCTLMRWTATAPFTLAAAYRLTELINGTSLTPLPALISDKSFLILSLRITLQNKLIGTLSLIPAFFFGAVGVSLLHSAHSTGEVFLTVHAFALTVLSVMIWVSVKLTLAAVPFIIADKRDMGSWRAALTALRILHGRKPVIVRTALLYLPPMLTVIAFPSALTSLMTAFALCVSIGIKEEEYIRRQSPAAQTAARKEAL